MALRRQSRDHSAERGYVMLYLLLLMALGVIAAAVVAPKIAFEIRRDREEEMIHRGAQYSRAIRLYYRKFGRYPMKVEDLENTNQMRFLRKRYKDPLNCKDGKCADFRLLHYGEAKLSMNGIGGGVIPGASTVGANGSMVNSSSVSTFGANTGMATSNSVFGSNSGFGQSSNSAFGQNSPATSNQTAAGTDASQSGTSASGTDQNAASNTTGNSSDSITGKTFGGAPIVGVASFSKDPTIREFDHKKKYSDWQFVYDPTFDRGFLITTPYQPSVAMQGTMYGQGGTIPGATTPGSGNSFGTGFGNSPSPMQNQPIQPAGGMGNPNPSPPQQ